MISCTEFIPLYSEFFKYLEAKDGEDAVLKFWYALSDRNLGDTTNPHSLKSFCEKYGGFDGAIKYWTHTLTEEACDVYKLHDMEGRYSYSHMRHCPSRGMLNDLKHVEPYHNYCEHCNVIYQRVLEKYDVCYERDNSRIDNAECFSVLYEKGHKPSAPMTEVDSLDTTGKVVVDMKPEDNKYLHRDFHLLGDFALVYCGEQYGDEGVMEFLTAYVKGYYSPVIENAKKGGLNAVKEWIEKVYEIEEASELLHTDLTDTTLTVTIDKSPVIEYMKGLNQKPSKYYIEETRTMYKVVAEESGLSFELLYYNEDGGAKFVFTAK